MKFSHICLGVYPELLSNRILAAYITLSKPEWCPAIYATSTGCIKLTDEQATYLNERGGNRTMAPSV